MTKRFVPQGVMPALVTPFTKDGDIIEDGFKQVIDYSIGKGATGVVPAGTTGEFSYMRTEERKKLFKLTVEFVDGRVPIVAGTGQHSTRATVALTKYAADTGCDAALVISPYYLRPSDKGYYEHYETVARKADLPIILYNIPQCTLGVLNSNIVEDLADIDNIVGIKDSGGNIGHTLELIQKLKGKIPVLIGHDECFLSAIAAGASAAILASGNIIPHIWLEIMEKVKQGDVQGASELQLKVQTLARIVTRNGGAPPVKAALRMMGINAGRCRMPLNSGGTLTRELKEEIRLELENLGIIAALGHPPIESDIDISSSLESMGAGLKSTDGVKFGNGGDGMVSVGIAAGDKNGPIGTAFVKLLTTPRIGHEALTVILEPNLPVRPISLMFPLRKIESMRQASLFYGPVQSGAAQAVAELLKAGKIPKYAINNQVVIMSLDIDLNTRERRVVRAETKKAVFDALRQIWS
ncbi:MAG: 4-hydroxy-tetrahydrodipicolinate synthase [Candidatus Thorarchaeota archaeon]|nr:4-hydroxy-tetrahydrodipicolinate synthase [Candidatus Thorarchaeota archaeon]